MMEIQPVTNCEACFKTYTLVYSDLKETGYNVDDTFVMNYDNITEKLINFVCHARNAREGNVGGESRLEIIPEE